MQQSPSVVTTWPPFRDGFLLIAFRDGTTAAQLNAVLAVERAVNIRAVGPRAHLIHVGPRNELDAIDRLKGHKEVLYVEPDFIHRLSGGATPTDSYIGNQWAASNTGQTVNGSSGTAGADQRSTSAWSVTTGTNSVSVAVLDTGVQYSHPDLVTNIWNNPGGIGGCAAGTHGYNVLDGTCDPMDDDNSYGGHGTHVAGILGAVGNNRAGVAGVNWTTSIIPVKWVNASNTGYTSDLISAMDWVIQAKQAGINIRVVNDSATWPGTAVSQALSDEIDLLGANDILLVTAAGNTAQNNDTTPRYPCSYNRPNMICAGASDQNDQLWGSSNYGITTVQLAAPGVNIFSTLRQSNYGYISGGSMASPQVAGTAALILSIGYLSATNLRVAILNSVDSLTSLEGLIASGGRLNVCKAVPGCSSGAPAVPSNSQAPIVTGAPQYGSLLAASTGIWSGLPTSYTYQWYRCTSPSCSAVTGATNSTYAALAGVDVGATFQVAVTASNSLGATTGFSAPTLSLASTPSPFAIFSNVQDGTTITGNVSWQVTSGTSVNFVQFYIDGVLSETVASPPYIYNYTSTGVLDTTTLSNGTHVLGVRALTADNRSYGFYGGTVSVQNGPQSVSPPLVTGTASQGQTLETSAGSWSGSPTQFAYQWNRCDTNAANCSAISGANGNLYTVSLADVGSTLRSSVTASNSSGSNTELSAPTATVTGRNGTGSGIALVQSNAVGGTGVGSLMVPFRTNNTPGDLIIVFVRMSSSTQTVTVTDTQGNAYIDAVSQTQSADGHQSHLFYAPNINRGPNTVAVGFSATNNHPWAAVYEYSGLSAASPLDQTAHNQGSSGLPNSGSTALTDSTNELVFAATGLPSSYTGSVSAGGGYMIQNQNSSTSRAATEALFASSRGSDAGTFTLSSPTNWSAIVATFRGASQP